MLVKMESSGGGGGSVTHRSYASGSGSDVTIQHSGTIKSVCMIEKYGSATTASYWSDDDATHIYQYWVNGTIFTLSNPQTADGNTIKSVSGDTVVVNLGSTATNIEIFVS